MDKETDRRLDQFTGKLLKDFTQEMPSLDFTTKVMAQVEVLEKSRVDKDKPLISKRLWWIFGILVSAVFSYSIFGNVQFENSWTMPKIFDLASEISSFTMPNFRISNVFLYGVVGFTFFLGVQIFLLKNHFNKRFALS